MKRSSHSLQKMDGTSRPVSAGLRLRPIAYCVMLACGNGAWANPTGPQIVNGAVTMQRPDARTLNVTNSPGSIINWQGFSIGGGEVTRFVQQSASSAVLNRVVGADISQIAGQLLSNGRVFLINPAGILIGAGAVIDTAGFVGSTLNMQDADFLAGKLRFQGDASAGSIVNQGWIKTSSGGNVVFVAPHIENSGLIETPGGELILAAGQKVTIGSLDLEGVQFEIQAPTDSVVNVGKLIADGGAVGVFAGTLRHSGDIRANALTRDEAGRIVLSAQKDVLADSGSTISASGPQGGGITIRVGENAHLAGRIDATGTAGRGGIIELLGKLVNLITGASANASGKTAGGSVSVSGPVVLQVGDVRADGASGGAVSVQATHLLQAGAATADGSAGAGGTVTVSADSIIQTAATLLSANGNGGAGGAVTVAAGQKTGDGIFSSATLSASGSTSGGRVAVTGNEIVMRGAQLNASGDTRGGAVLVGGDWQGKNPDVPNAQRTQVNFSTTLKADAKQDGDGGKVVVWSDQKTQFFGTISARGGAQSGDGGRIEVSGKENLFFGGFADASAPHGVPGSLLLDPKNVVIDSSSGGGASVIDLVDPHIGASEQFGTTAVILSNGNVVASDPNDSFVASNAGAVYLFNGSTGALISSLTGSTADDAVSSGGMTLLTNGDYVVRSPNWANGMATGAGAVTFGSRTTGASGAVSAANSLVGSTSGDQVGGGCGEAGCFGGVTALTNGNYVVISPQWNNGAATQAGAVTLRGGTSGVSGVVSAANSLVGSTTDDLVGRSGVTALTNGNYVVISEQWNNGAATQAGAVTFGSGTSGVSGAVSASNSLVGTTMNDGVGSGGVTTLPVNNNFVVSSPNWNNGAATRAGAATFGSATSGVSGAVSAANSLVGSTTNDQVASGTFGGDTAGVTALTNGNYVVLSPIWNNGAATRAGAVTFGSGTSGVAGAVSATNSLVGDAIDDIVGRRGLTALPNGNYVVFSDIWHSFGAATGGLGAVTFGSGTSGITGVVSAANSLVGSTQNDQVGFDTAVVLGNNNYVVISSIWNNGAATRAGAVTFVNGANGNVFNTGSPGAVVAAANSLVGTNASDFVGADGVATLLNNNNNYVVVSSNWRNVAAAQAGAVTFGSGTSGVAGAVSATNSLVGATANDSVGSSGLATLTNGNYVVRSPDWNNGAATQAGAATFGSGTSGVAGVVSAANSLVGTSANDGVGGRVTALTNGNYVVSSPNWNNGAATRAGAATFGSGTSGVVGIVSAANSLVGTTAEDQVGTFGVTTLPNGNYVVNSAFWNNGAATQAGAVTFGSGTSGVIGAVSAANSLVGTTANDQVGFDGVTVLTNGNYVVNSQNWNNGAATTAGAVTFLDGTNGNVFNTGSPGAVVAAANSLVGSTTNDRVGTGGVTALTNGNYVVSSSFWSNGAATQAGAVTFGSGTSGVAGPVSAANSLVGSSANDQVGSGGVTELSGNRVLVQSPVFDNGPVDSGRLQIYDGTGSSGTFSNPLIFSDNSAGNTTVTPATITAITNAGTAVTLQANNDITLNASSNITTSATGNGGNITMQAGRSIVLNSNITSDNGTVRVTANETQANGVVVANRDAGAATLAMAAGTTINAGTGNIFLRIADGAGHDQTTGNLVVGSLTGTNVSIIHDGVTANSAILRANSNSLITATGSPVGGVFMELENAAGANASIGTSAAPMRVSATNLDSHYHNASGGIFIDSPNAGNLQIGGSPAFIQTGGNIQGVQTVSGGPISISVNGTLTQFAGTGAPCGPAGGLTGGPICAGASGSTNAADILTLRANDMSFTRPVAGNSVVLVPNAGGTISPGTAGGTNPSLYLVQSEIDQISTTSLRIGERVASGDPSSSGDIVFGSGITAPGNASIALRTGGSVTASGAATDIATNNNANITVNAGTGIGSSGAGRLRLNPGTGNVTAHTTSGGIFLQQSVGNMDASKYSIISTGANPSFELATTDGNISMPGINYNGGSVSLITGGASRDIAFSGTGSFILSGFTFSPTGSTTFNSGTQTFTAPVITSGPLSFASGTANFNQAVTMSTTNSALAISSGAANFNAASTIAGAVTVNGSGTLGGTGAVTANNGLTFTGGTISSTGGVTVPGTTTINAGTPQLTGTLATGAFNMSAGTLDIAAGGALSLTGTGANTVSGGTLNNAGTLNLNGGGLAISGAPTLTNAAGGIFNIGAGAGDINFSSTQLFTNNGTLNSAGNHQIGSGASTSFHNTGAVNVTSGTLSLLVLDVDSGGPLGDTGSYTASAGATVRFRDANRDFLAASSIGGAGSVQFDSGSGGTFNVSGAYNPMGNTIIFGATVNFRSTATLPLLNMTAGTLNVTGTGILNLTGAGAKTVSGGTLTNSGMIHLQGGTLQVNGAFPTNNGTLEIDAGTTLSTTAALTNSSSGFIHGGGTINLAGNTLTNNGTVAPGASPGILTINGNYTQTASGTLVAELGGTSPGVGGYDQLQVTGNVSLDGTLNVLYFAPFTGGGNTYDIMTYNSNSGNTNFASFNFPAGSSFQASVMPTLYRLVQQGSSSSGPSSSSASMTSANDVAALNERLADTTSYEAEQPPKKLFATPLCN